MPILFSRREVLLREREYCRYPKGHKLGGKFAPNSVCGTASTVRDASPKYGGSTAPHPDASRDEIMAMVTVNPFPDWLQKEITTAERVNQRSRELHGGKNSEDFHRTRPRGFDEDGKPIMGFSAERERLHEKILDKLFKGMKRAEGQPTIVLMGGLPGAGKTHSVGKRMDLDGKVVINADEIKDMLPEYNGNNAEFVHEESSYLAKLALRIAAGRRYNVVFDATMASVSSVNKQLDQYFVPAGYRVESRFVDVPLQHSLRSTMTRFYQGQQAPADRRIRGRYVPAKFITIQHDPTHGSKPRATFEQLKDNFSAWELVDGTTGRILDSKGTLSWSKKRRVKESRTASIWLTPAGAGGRPSPRGRTRTAWPRL